MDDAFSSGGCYQCGFNSAGTCVCDRGPYGAMACQSAALACSANTFDPCPRAETGITCYDRKSRTYPMALREIYSPGLHYLRRQVSTKLRSY